MSSFYGSGGGGGGLSSGDLEAITSKIFKFEIVNALPENNISDSTIYLIPTGEQEDNIYTEYVYINNHWEKFGTQKMDLTNYVTLEFFNEKLAAKQDSLTAGSNISITDVDGEFIISAVDTTYSDATQQMHGLMSTADKTKLDGITAAKMQAWDVAEQNVNADWTAESGDAQILHKPDLSIYALAANVTKSALGIDNVDNTSDADKPISTATETALAEKVDKETNKSLMTADEHTKLSGIETGAQVNTVTGVKGSNEAEYRTGNVSITKGNVGLGNVDNTADADKPISTAAQTALDGKVDKITGKGLSEANFTDAEKTKLAGIATGAEVNVQSDWNQGNDAADDYIKNKPSNLVQDASYVHTDNNFTNAEKAKADGAIQSTEKGAANGIAELDANGKVPTSQLPAYVDDVLSYNSLSDFPATGEDGKIYIAKDTNLSYRWGSSEYVVISPSLALGSTSSTAYRGDWGAEDRAAIGTLSTLNTMEKSNLVGAINELKTDSDAKQGTLTFDSAPTSGSTNPVTSGGVYTALAGKQGTLTFDSTPTENSTNPVTSGGIYNALAGKADATATQTALNSKADATATQTALAGKQNALTAGANITIETVNDALTISATGTTYSAGSGLSMSGTTINHSNSVTAGTAKGDDTKTLTFGGTFAIPTITFDAQGHVTGKGSTTMTMPQLPSRRTVLNSNSVNLITSTNRELDLGLGNDVANYEAIEIRYLQYSNGSTNYYTTLRAANSGGSYGVIPAIRYIHNTATGVLNICICQLSLSGTKLKLVDDGGMPSGNTFYVSTVIGYR